MSNATIGEVLARQFDRIWDSFRDAISNMSDDEWRNSDCDWLTPIRLAYHLVETMEFYTFTSPEDGTEPVNWDHGPIDDLPSQSELLVEVDRVQSTVRNWLTSCSDAE